MSLPLKFEVFSYLAASDWETALYYIGNTPLEIKKFLFVGAMIAKHYIM